MDAGEQCARWVKKQLEWDGLRNARPGAGRHLPLMDMITLSVVMAFPRYDIRLPYL